MYWRVMRGKSCKMCLPYIYRYLLTKWEVSLIFKYNQAFKDISISTKNEQVKIQNDQFQTNKFCSKILCLFAVHLQCKNKNFSPSP